MSDVSDTTTERLVTRQVAVETELKFLTKGLDELKSTVKDEIGKLQANFQAAGKDNFDRLVQIVESKERIQAEREKARVENEARLEAENKKTRERTQYIWIGAIILLGLISYGGKFLELLRGIIK